MTATLSHDEVKDLTGYTWPSKQLRELHRIKGKGRVRILIEWTPALKAAVDACAEGTDRIGHLLKTTRKGKAAAGGKYSYWGIRSAWVRACERAKIDPKDLHIHDMRGRAGVDKREAEGKSESPTG